MFDFHVFGMLLSNVKDFKKSPLGKLYRSLSLPNEENFFPSSSYKSLINFMYSTCVFYSPKFSSILQSFPELRDNGNFFRVESALKII